MGSNWGNVNAGAIWFDVSLDVAPEQIGDACAVFCSDENITAQWEIIVFANVMEGQYQAGRMVTRSAQQGDPMSRMVAIANVPGARAWKVSARSVDPLGNYQAQITLASSATPAGAGFGVTAIKHGDDSSANPSYQNGTTAAGPVQASGPQTVALTASGTLEQANIAGAEGWIMLFDSLAPPLAGAVPFWSAHLGAAAGAAPDVSNWRYDAGPFGRRIALGWFVAVSSTPTTYAPAPVSSDVHAVFALT